MTGSPARPARRPFRTTTCRDELARTCVAVSHAPAPGSPRARIAPYKWYAGPIARSSIRLDEAIGARRAQLVRRTGRIQRAGDHGQSAARSLRRSRSPCGDQGHRAVKPASARRNCAAATVGFRSPGPSTDAFRAARRPRDALRAHVQVGDVSRVLVVIELSLPALKAHGGRRPVQPAWASFRARQSRYGLPPPGFVTHARARARAGHCLES